jgi:hypothetical protein
MIVRHEFLQADRTPPYLPPLHRAKPRRRLANPLRRGPRGQRFEEFLILVPSHRQTPNESNPVVGFYAIKTGQTLPKTIRNAGLIDPLCQSCRALAIARHSDCEA